MQAERRYLSVDEMGDDGLGYEQRDDGGVTIRGISPPWNSLSVDLGGFREQFSPTAFDRILARHKNDPRGPVDVVGLFNHEDSQLLSRTTNGTLRLSKAATGLGAEMDLPDTQLGRDLGTLIRTKTLFGASFAFSVSQTGEQWTQDEKGNAVRTVTDANLYDWSPVTRPAYPSSSVGLRSLEAWKEARAVAGSEGLLISIDYDKTFTAAPGLWRSFIADATARGNRVCCITRRADDEKNREELRLAFAELDVAQVLLAGPERQKRQAAAEAGLEVDIWIDDAPETIPTKPEPRAVRPSTLLGLRATAAATAARLRLYAR
jgi:HK97 family phage prohead protease